ncbi:MAG: WbqC family protein [Endomicrobia bacterium]|nr:WbqC family protein [Endomicrobiia bacterium]
MKIAIHQPQFLPWPGYFNKILRSDLFIFLDDVQYKKNEWQNRNRIKTSRGEAYITVPVHYRFGEKINEIKIVNSVAWKKNHLKTIKINYERAKYFEDFYIYIENFLQNNYEKLVEVNIQSIKMIMSYLGFEKKFILSSSLNVDGQKTTKLVNICKILKATVYISGIGARDYIDLKQFYDNNINVQFQEYSTPTYQQLFGEFIPNLSIIDMIFNVGKEDTLKLIGA